MQKKTQILFREFKVNCKVKEMKIFANSKLFSLFVLKNLHFSPFFLLPDLDGWIADYLQ